MEPTLRTPISILHIVKTSLLTAIGMISFFLLMKLFSLSSIPELRFLNFIFLFIGVRHVLLHKQSADGIKVRFHTAMMMGFISVFFASVLFSGFVFAYLNIDAAFMNLLRVSQPFGSYLTPASGAFVTFLEGIGAGAVIAIPVLFTMRGRAPSTLDNEPIRQLAN